MFSFQQGDCLTFKYATSGEASRWIEVIEVRDIRTKPLRPITLAIDPDRERGDLLVIAFDLHKCALRKFYVEKMTDVQRTETPDWVLASYDPLNPDEPPMLIPAHTVGHVTLLELFVLMRRGNARMSKNPDIHRMLGIFSASAVPKFRSYVRRVQTDVKTKRRL